MFSRECFEMFVYVASLASKKELPCSSILQWLGTCFFLGSDKHPSCFPSYQLEIFDMAFFKHS